MLALLSGEVLKSGPFRWVLILADLPKFSPVLKSLCHPLIWWQIPVGPFPGKFTATQAAKEPFEASGVALLEPCFVLEVVLIISCLVCLLKLMIDGMSDQISSVAILVFVPTVAGVQKLAPCWSTNPVLGHISNGLREAFGGAAQLLWWLFEC